ncbi:Peroxidase 46 [Glycine soja]|nr:Peroxidase 46 [Glycine soja]
MDHFIICRDVSLMLQGNNTEQSDPGNRSVGGFSVIDSAKRILEKFCPRTVSCADIIALAAGDAVEIAGEPRTMIPTGAHTIGTAHCSSFRDRFQEDSKGNLRLIDKTLYSDYANELMKQCPAGVQPSVTVNNDPETSKVFDNMYYQNLLAHKGLFQSDSVLISNGSTRKLVEDFANDQELF